jgi:chromosome partitioning protein
LKYELRGQGGATVRTIAVLNFKGGSAKTTTALALAVGIAHKLPKRQRVLLVDCDPQSNATLIMMDGAAPTGPTLADVLLADADAAEAIRETRVDRLDILPADVGLANVGGLLADELARERRLHRALKTVESRYAVCVIDSPPELSLLTVNVLTAVSEVLIPVDPGVFAVAGLGRLQETVDRIRHHLEHTELGILGLLITRATRNKMAIDLEQQLREVYGSLVFKSVIPASAAVEEAHASNRTILEWSPESPAGAAYAALVAEVLKHGQGKRVARNRRQKPHAA